MTRRKAFIMVLSLFLVSVLVRLPNMNRPVSKHHEFMSALMLINIESWRQAGGASHFHFIPLLNFQNPGDKYPDKNIWVDNKGNQWYLSLPPGWYIIPYVIYQVFSLPAEPIYLRVINLVFNLFSVLLFFYFLEKILTEKIKNRYETILAGCFLFLFTPGMLWYLGNGYAHTGIMLPFIIGLLLLVIPMLDNPSNIVPRRLLALSALILVFSFLDWYILFIVAAVGLFSLWKIRKDKRYGLLLITVGLGISLGIMLLFFQFASYGGTDAVLAYWKARFFIRTVANEGNSFFIMIAWLGIHSVTLFLPLILLIIGCLTWNVFKKIKIGLSSRELIFISLYSLSLLLYNMVLLEWSYEHEFSMLPWGLLLAYLGVRLLVPFLRNKSGVFLLVIVFLISLTQYYFINRPGKISRDGMGYDTFKVFGEQLKKLPLDCMIFSPLEQRAPMIEYYAGRNIFIEPNYDSAKKFMLKTNIKTAVWVEEENYRIKEIRFIK